MREDTGRQLVLTLCADLAVLFEAAALRVAFVPDVVVVGLAPDAVNTRPA